MKPNKSDEVSDSWRNNTLVLVGYSIGLILAGFLAAAIR